MFRKKKTLALALGIFTLLIGAVFFWQANPTSGITEDEEYYQSLRNALTETNLPTDSNPARISSSVDNLANFIQYRSGIQISSANKTLLRDSEQKSWDQSKRVTQAQLSEILTDVAFDKLVTLSDADISSMAETLRGFNTAAYSAMYPDARQFVRLRASGEGMMEPNSFIYNEPHNSDK